MPRLALLVRNSLRDPVITTAGPHARLSRRRLPYVVLSLGTIALGLATRRCSACFPRFVAEYGGDTLYATLVFFLLALVAPRARRGGLAAGAFAFSAAVEFSQAWRTPLLDAVRANPLGRLVLGTTFVPSDFACYLVGALLGAAVDASVSSRRPR